MSLSNVESVIECQKKNPVLLMDIEGNKNLTFDHPSINDKKSLVEAAIAALEAGETHYADVPGVFKLRKLIGNYFQELGTSNINAENVLVTTGINESRFLSIQVLGQDLDGIAIPSVIDPNVKNIISLRKINTAYMGCNLQDYQTQIDEILRAVQTGYKLIYIENPSRLTGKLLLDGKLEEFFSILERNDAYSIIDIGFLPWTKNCKAQLSVLNQRFDRIALIGEAFPGIAVKGIQVGFIAANQDWIKAIQVQKQIISICTSAPTQYGAIKAGEIYHEKHNDSLEKLTELKTKIASSLHNKGIEIIPAESENIFAVRCCDNGIFTALKRANYAVLQGKIFGANDVSRFSVPLDEVDIEKILSIIS